ncbi:MAG: rhodanese-like domain-containing protein [Planctomycetota bacterium]|jgi:rhodanese-related sulfurtransferase
MTSLKRTYHDLTAEAGERVGEIDTAGLMQLHRDGADLVLIDVRERDEWDGGRLPGAVHVARGVLERDVEAACFDGRVRPADLDRAVVCYCASGSRSLLAADQLRRMGFTDARSLRGGIRGWRDAGGGVVV